MIIFHWPEYPDFKRKIPQPCLQASSVFSHLGQLQSQRLFFCEAKEGGSENSQLFWFSWEIWWSTTGVVDFWTICSDNPFLLLRLKMRTSSVTISFDADDSCVDVFWKRKAVQQMLLMRSGETTSTTHVAARLQTNYTGGATSAGDFGTAPVIIRFQIGIFLRYFRYTYSILQ